MPLLKRKPVLMHHLPSFGAIVQPVNPPANPAATSTADGQSDPSAPAPPPPPAAAPIDLPQDANDDDEQLDKLLTALNDPVLAAPPPRRSKVDKVNGQAAPVNGGPNALAQPPLPGPSYRVKNVEVFYMPETGEIFLDYESYAARRAFYDLPLFQCEVSGRSALSFFDARENETYEVRQLHARFPKPLRKAVLLSVQFQVEGKLETLADKIFERFVNRFFDDEKVFVDVQGDKYLARIVRTFPPKNLVLPPGVQAPSYHPYATDLNLDLADVDEHDDPMKYFYQVRLIEEGGEVGAEYASTNGASHEEDDGKGEKWQGSVMEVQADKISRDRINFSRAMLKRFIRDCVSRDAAICSPWLVKKPVAARYAIPTEMPEAQRLRIIEAKERQMGKRKRDREDRLGLPHSDDELADEDHPQKKTKKTKEERDREREQNKLNKESEKERIKREKEEEKRREEEERKKKKPNKYPCEDLLLEYSAEREGAQGKPEVRPAPNKQVPFGEQFEKFLLSWSFLNVMGKPLGLSPFTLDDFEQSLYHTDPYTAPVPLLTEIHAVLLNALIKDSTDGHEPVRPLALTGQMPDNDTDYWEGTKGATAETLRPIVEPMAETWKTRELSRRDSRKGWENALVGCLWERATLDTMPQYLDNILYLTFEDKPAPTRPTWSTGPSSNTSHGLIAAKPDRRYTSLHFVHKLNILNFLIELVAQTALIRDFMEEATAALTEVRKDQVELRRDLRRVRAEREALEPKNEEGENGGEDADGDVSMSVVKEEASSRAASPNGHANGTIDADELDGSMLDDRSRASSVASDVGRAKSGAQRRKAMLEKAAEREAEEAQKLAKAAKERQESKAKKAELKHIQTEKKRLADEEAALDTQLKQLEYDFRRHFYTLRTRPLGSDRFGNKVWWIDGLGSSPLYNESGKVIWGTGRLYIQGADDLEVEFCRIPAELSPEDTEARRDKEEGEGRLAPGQWASYDTPELANEFFKWLNIRGTREMYLLRALNPWWPDIIESITRRRVAQGLDVAADSERRARPTRRVAGGDEPEGYLGWRNKRAAGGKE
ncbi:hypothetical protein Q8F55_007945 [Vanrija albida]|uniref:DDT domain-containing protein n=1 Tax=Vanrija albida TaxID=181172 RepID=A0ABR3PUX2_9TREE